MERHRPLAVAILLSILLAALAIHAWQCFFKAPTPAPGFFLWFMLPYAIAGLFLWRAGSLVPCIAGASVALVLDLYMHYTVFIEPRGSTAAVGLVLAPIYSAFALVPVTCFVVRLAMKRKPSAG